MKQGTRETIRGRIQALERAIQPGDPRGWSVSQLVAMSYDLPPVPSTPERVIAGRVRDLEALVLAVGTPEAGR